VSACDGCLEARAIGLARCLNCARALAKHRNVLASEARKILGPSANDLYAGRRR
jgi:hypothetical protein